MPNKALIVEDNISQGQQLKSLLEEKGYVCQWATNINKGFKYLSQFEFQLAFIDYQLPDGYGISLLKLAGEHNIKLPTTIMMTAYASISRAVDAIKLGASDFLEKPIHARDIESILQKLNKSPSATSSISMNHNLVYTPGSPMEQVMELCQAVAHKNCNIYLAGESGSGKEVIAQYIHHLRFKNSSPFVAINCGAIVESLFESEFFGHSKGAFTGANSNNPGKLKLAEGGTLFLDEVGDLPFFMQTKLLRALQEKKAMPVGGQKEVEFDFRLICATHKNLEEMLNQGQFREDLYFRIHVIKIPIPPLRERPMDIAVLFQHFLQKQLPSDKISEILGQFPFEFSNYPWPGNVRELKNFCEKLLIFREIGKNPSDIFNLHLRSHYRQNSNSNEIQTYSVQKTLTEDKILEALRLNQHHRQKTADYLGISRRTLQYRLAKMAKSHLN